MALRAPDLHPDDAAARLRLRQQMIDYRISRNITHGALGEARGLKRHSAGQPERVENWQVSKLQAHLGALGGRLLAVPRKRAHVKLALIAPDDPQVSWTWDRVQMMALLIDLRDERGLTQRELGKLLGREESVISSTECRDDWLLHTLQRHARALGDELLLSIEWEDGE